MKIAIIGSGISGLTCAHLLSNHHDVALFEANNYLGGHTATVNVTDHQGSHRIDTGFIVFNDRTYPRFEKLLKRIGAQKQITEMSFSVCNTEKSLEYNGHSLNTLFAQRSNLLRPAFYRLIKEILRFNKDCIERYNSNQLDNISLAEYLNRGRYHPDFRDNYLLPMIGAIWSCSLQHASEFPLRFFVKFFYHHGLLNIQDRPQWYVMKNGSDSYIPLLLKGIEKNCHLNSPVQRVKRTPTGIYVTSNDKEQNFDRVIMACHSDQSLNMLENPSPTEQEILGQIPYQANDVILHTDSSLMPQRSAAWASWNFRLNHLAQQRDKPALVTYYMNRLQGLTLDADYFVTLNGEDLIDPAHIIQRFSYAHPVFDSSTMNAQQQRRRICGVDRIHYCGAYWYNGFHEDGVHSALDVCDDLGIAL